MQKYLKIFTNNPLFAGISPEKIPQMLHTLGAVLKTYEKEEYIRQTGDPADFIGLVLEGSIQILRDDYYGNRNITATFGPGGIFAEAFACANTDTLPVDVLSCDRTTIMFIDRDSIFLHCEKDCPFREILVRNLLQIMARKNILLTRKLRYSSHKTTREKIMAYLNDQAKLHHSPEFTIPFDRQELADYLGVERSAMSAEISKLVKLGYIQTKKSHFVLLQAFEA